MPMTEYKFTKMQGTGNDFVVFDTFTQNLQLIPQQIRDIADRHYGIGCDQVLLLEPPDKNDPAHADIDVHYRIFNADGGEVMQCGNGARCAAIYLKQKELVQKNEVIAKTGANNNLTLAVSNDNMVIVSIGAPVFAQLPLSMANSQTTTPASSSLYTFELDKYKLEVFLLSLGNPHAVVTKIDGYSYDIDKAPVEAIGRALQADINNFPESVNVSFFQILNPELLQVRVYERGAGETLACGSGACAAMVVAHQQYNHPQTTGIKLRGGDLTVGWIEKRQSIYLKGDAHIVFEGKIVL